MVKYKCLNNELFQDLIERCKRAFQELLLEKADLFYQFRFSPQISFQSASDDFGLFNLHLIMIMIKCSSQVEPGRNGDTR